MRSIVVSLALALGSSSLALADGPAQVDEAPMRRITIVLGGFELLRLEAPVSVGVCDDTSIVRVEDGGDALRLVGLKVGKTQCGFWTQQRTGQHTMVEVIVTTAPPRKH